MWLQDGWTPLMYAVKKGHVEAMKLLLNEAVEISTTNKVPFFHHYFVCESAECLERKYQLFSIKTTGKVSGWYFIAR